MNQASNQSGFALITVLIVQLMIGVIAYAAIDTAILGQNQTYASNESHLAYNGAEQILIEGMRCIQRAHKAGENIDTCKTFNNDTQNGLTIEDNDHGPGMVLTASRGEDSGARRTITLTAKPPLTNTLYDANGAYTCFGSNCEYEPPSSAASPGSDGTDRMLPGHNDASPLDQLCGNNGNSRPPVNPDGEDKAGLIMPNVPMADAGGGNGNGNGNGGGGKKTQFEGNPPIVDSPEQYDNLYGEDGDLASETLDKAVADLNGRIDALIPGATTFEDNKKKLAEGETGIWRVKEGQTLEIDKIAGGTVILDGGKLDITGNTCFAGMVVSRNNGQITAGGTSAIVGAALQVADFMQEAGLGGNASMFYSSSTLEWAREVSNNTNSGERWSFGNYQQVTN